MGDFEIRTWYDGKTRGNLRKVAVVQAPTGMHALREFAGKRQAIIRQRRTGDDSVQWMATILIGHGRLRDYIAVRI
jgi:predicted nuclease of restriction endonuclease-like (RecB) superfamily